MLKPLLVTCLLAAPAAADDLAERIALDASVGPATLSVDDYTAAFGASLGAGVRVHEHIVLGARAAGYFGDAAMWFIGPAFESRFGGTSIAVALGRASLRDVYARDNGMGMLFGRKDTDTGPGLHARIGQLVWRQVEVSAEVLAADIPTLHIDLASIDRYYAASASVGYRFF